MTPQVRSHFQDPGRVRDLTCFDRLEFQCRYLWRVSPSLDACLRVALTGISSYKYSCRKQDRKPRWFILGEEKSNQWWWSACFFSVPHTSKVSCNVLKENKPTIAISSCWLLSSSCWLHSSKQITTDHNHLNDARKNRESGAPHHPLCPKRPQEFLGLATPLKSAKELWNGTSRSYVPICEIHSNKNMFKSVQHSST